MITVEDKETYQEFLSFKHTPGVNVISEFEKDEYVVYEFNTDEQIAVLKDLINDNPYDDTFIFGKDQTLRVVNTSVRDNACHLFIQDEDGNITEEVRPSQSWMVSRQLLTGFKRLSGNNYYNYIRYYDDRKEFMRDRGALRNKDIWSVYDTQESNLINSGITYFKGLKASDISVLSSDIETTGKNHNKDSKVLVISNTLRHKGKITKKLFTYDDYNTVGEMIDAWCEWVRKMDPSIIVGHNFFGFDLPYLSYCYTQEYDHDLPLGRDGSPIEYNSYTSQKRKDGSQSYEYTNAKIFGRDVVDTFFLSINYDIKREFVSYALKQIIKQLGLEREGRQHYDAAMIGRNYKIPAEWAKIKEYGKDDADDALKLFDLMIPSFFYFTQSIPKTLQQIINSATGSQVNSFLVRSYIAEGKGLPKASEIIQFEGAISLGVPGVYKNLARVDVKSMYPSIVIQYKLYNRRKDPDAHFLKMTTYFTEQRLRDKEMFEETSDKHYDDLSNSRKIFINSAYGLLNAPGLLFNSPVDGATVTRKGREIISHGVKWASGYDIVKNENYKEEKEDKYRLVPSESKGKGFSIANIDTDAFSFSNSGKPWNDKYFNEILRELNGTLPEKIIFGNDGYFPRFCVLKTKNYAQDDGKKIRFKGSAIIDQKKEPILQQFIKDCVISLMDGKKDLHDIYKKYVKSACEIKDIEPWCIKNTVTKKVLESDNTRQKKIFDAIGDMHVQEGDKIWLFTGKPIMVPKIVKGEPQFYKKTGLPIMKKDSPIFLKEKWKPGEEDKFHYVERVHDTLTILENLVNIDEYPEYHSNQHLLEAL